MFVRLDGWMDGCIMSKIRVSSWRTNFIPSVTSTETLIRELFTLVESIKTAKSRKGRLDFYVTFVGADWEHMIKVMTNCSGRSLVCLLDSFERDNEFAGLQITVF
jgi:hypothetical protein